MLGISELLNRSRSASPMASAPEPPDIAFNGESSNSEVNSNYDNSTPETISNEETESVANENLDSSNSASTPASGNMTPEALHTHEAPAKLASKVECEPGLTINTSGRRVTKLHRSRIHPHALKHVRLIDIALRRKSSSKRASNPETFGSKLHRKFLEAGLRVRLVSCPSIYEIFRQLTPATSRGQALFSMEFDNQSAVLRAHDLSAELHVSHPVHSPRKRSERDFKSGMANHGRMSKNGRHLELGQQQEAGRICEGHGFGESRPSRQGQLHSEPRKPLVKDEPAGPGLDLNRCEGRPSQDHDFRLSDPRFNTDSKDPRLSDPRYDTDSKDSGFDSKDSGLDSKDSGFDCKDSRLDSKDSKDSRLLHSLPSVLKTGKLDTRVIRLIDNNLVDLAGVPSKVLKSLQYDSDIHGIQPHDLVGTFNCLDTAVSSVFKIHRYSLVRVTKSASTNSEPSVLMKLETAHPGDPSLIDDGEYIEDMVTSLGRRNTSPSNLFLKKVVARPRYKVDMKLYFVPYAESMSLYVDSRILERDLINGVVDVNSDPDRMLYTTFDPTPVLQHVSHLIHESDLHVRSHPEDDPSLALHVPNHIIDNLSSYMFRTPSCGDSEGYSSGSSSNSRSSLFSRASSSGSTSSGSSVVEQVP